jgi:hypothetical protein
LNRKQRRSLRFSKASGKPDLIATTPHKNMTLQLPPRQNQFPKWIQKAHVRVWGVVIIISTLAGLLGLNILRPDVLIDIYASTDPSRPFAQQFSVQNASVYAIRDVRSMCGFNRDSGIGLSDLSIEGEKVEVLEPGAKMTLTCRIGTGPIRHELNIVPWVLYAIPLGMHKCKAARFKGKPAAGGTYIWTYQGSEPCQYRDNRE